MSGAVPLCARERETIALELGRDKSDREIGRLLGRQEERGQARTVLTGASARPIRLTFWAVTILALIAHRFWSYWSLLLTH